VVTLVLDAYPVKRELRSRTPNVSNWLTAGLAPFVESVDASGMLSILRGKSARENTEGDLAMPDRKAKNLA